MMIDKKYYMCNRYRMMCELKELGFEPLKVLPSMENPRRFVWLYENTPELREAVEAYVARAIAYRDSHK